MKWDKAVFIRLIDERIESAIAQATEARAEAQRAVDSSLVEYDSSRSPEKLKAVGAVLTSLSRKGRVTSKAFEAEMAKRGFNYSGSNYLSHLFYGGHYLADKAAKPIPKPEDFPLWRLRSILLASGDTEVTTAAITGLGFDIKAIV